MSDIQTTLNTQAFVTRWVVSETPESPRFLPALSEVLTHALEHTSLNGMIPTEISHIREEPTGISFRLYAVRKS